MPLCTYVCIDLKSFYASVECVDRGLDPFSTNLVVADPSRGKGALCLAISPAMKALGVRNRCRLFEIPAHMRYITAIPRMQHYIDVSAEIYGIYLQMIAPEDIYVYSIDECFINIAPYLHLYKKTPREMAVFLMDTVRRKTGICATAGIGTNLFLAKVAMDIIAKHVDSHIGLLTEKSLQKTLWHHRPITDIWNIGKGIARRLEKYGVFDLYGVTLLPKSLLYKEFGCNAQFLIDHAWGRESCTLADIHSYQPESHSLSNSQILFSDYTAEDAGLLVHEMSRVLIDELLEKELATRAISLHIGYSHDEALSSGGTRRLASYTDVPSIITSAFTQLYHDKVRRLFPIRRLSLSLDQVIPAASVPVQLSLFENTEQEDKERIREKAIISIKRRFGKNAILRGTDLLPQSTARKRDTLIGGHNAGLCKP